MTTFKVISVNPSEKSIGELYNGRTCRKNLLNDRTMNRVRTGHSSRFTAFLFPTKDSGFKMSLLLLAMRLMFACILIYNGTYYISHNSDTGIFSIESAGYLFIISGILLASGLMTRIIMIFPAIIFISTAINSFVTHPDQLSILSGFLSISLCLTGPGWFSIDALLQKRITRKAG